MYGRSVPLVHVCLRHQVRQLRESRLGTPVFGLPLPRARLRWYETHAVAQPEDGEGQETPTEARLLPNRRPRTSGNTRFKHLKVHRIASLGVESLGKPAEVLILPSRQRQTSQTSPSENQDTDVDSKDFLGNELQPLAWNEVKSNIIHVKESVTNGEDKHLSRAKWGELQRNLVKGFTCNQLKKYLWEHLDSVQISDEIHNFKKKQEVANAIVKRVWQLETEQDSIQKKERLESESTQASSRTLEVDTLALDLGLHKGNNLLRDVSQTFGVQIDVFRNRSELRILGDRVSTARAKHALRVQLKSPMSTIIDHDLLGDGMKNLAMHEAFRTYLQSLMQSRPIRIVNQDDQIILYALCQSTLDIVTRELARATAEQVLAVGEHGYLETHDLACLSKLVVYPVASGGFFKDRQQWYRHTSLTAMRDATISTDVLSDVVSQTNNIRFRRLSSHGHQLKAWLGPAGNHIYADIGQVLFSKHDNSERDQPRNFVSKIAALPQALFREELPYIPQDAATKSRICFKLKPLDAGTGFPCFSINMSGADINKGIKQHLQIRDITMNFDPYICDALLPSKLADIRLTSQPDYTLFASGETPPTNDSLPLLQAISSVIQAMQNPSSEGERVIHNLDLSPLLESKAANTKATKSDATSVTHTPALGSTTTTQRSRSISSVPYYLEAPEWRDISTHSLKQHPGIKVQHIIIDAASEDPVERRELLRILEDPPPLQQVNKTTSKSASFEARAHLILDTAIHTVNAISEYARLS